MTCKKTQEENRKPIRVKAFNEDLADLMGLIPAIVFERISIIHLYPPYQDNKDYYKNFLDLQSLLDDFTYISHEDIIEALDKLISLNLIILENNQYLLKRQIT